jgi:SOS-response transcriptional repressor LexA
MLTDRQRDLMLFVEAYMDRTGGVSPTLREIKEGVKGFKGESCVSKTLAALAARGLVRRNWNYIRGIEVLKPISRFEYLKFDDKTKQLRPAQIGGVKMKMPG